MKAIWNDEVIAESNETVKMEGNYYFPETSLKKEFFKESESNTICPWKGTASYSTLVVNGKENRDAVWYYPNPSEAASVIKNHYAFWKGVEVVE
ncbi:DUF427 domain-containing protein [Chondrinema litorale]|uniref:DUF427 domain-containing protein n=1 Tax=Chondrinema litorale TaxID=2994555 RepID=UPI0025435A56|nr:DUF427 domain-containing protein [Chondrinema litorale]UZR93435.1 DUF427 domain-containing protein [Chondrinema litorale]